MAEATEDATLYHATADANLDSIAHNGMRPGSYWTSSLSLALYYAETIKDEGNKPVILRTSIEELLQIDPAALQPDLPGIDEPITSVIGMSEERVQEKWAKSRQTWQSCLEIIGSLKFSASVPPWLIHHENGAPRGARWTHTQT